VEDDGTQTELTACRACFDAADAEDERRMLMAAGIPPLPVAGDAFEPRYQKRLPNLIGTRVGRWTVTGVTYRQRRNGRALRCWVLRCSCGTPRVVPCDKLHDRGEKCGACTRREREQGRAPRYGGRLVSEWAEVAGVSLNAIRQRIKLGWPVNRLAEPGRAA
jgi:hypothetical protein